MWMSNIFIVVNAKNADRNTLHDLASAVLQTGTVIGVDEQSHTIEANVPAHELPIIAAMEGVSYVRCVFNYFCSVNAPLQAA